MLVNKAVFAAIGLLDEEFFYSFEDADFCLRAKAEGFSTVCVSNATAVHLGSTTLGKQSPSRFYYAARNHLRLVDRTSMGLPKPTASLPLKMASIAAGGLLRRER